MSKRALCATRTASPANARKRRTASSTGGAAAKLALTDPGERRDRRRQRHARVDERLERRPELERDDPLSADLDRSASVRGESPVVSRSKTTKSAASSANAAPGGSARARPASPRHASRASPATTSSSSDRAIAVGALASAKSVRAASSAGDRPAPRLDELDEPVGRVERELHPVESRRTYVRSSRTAREHERRAPVRAPSQSSEE